MLRPRRNLYRDYLELSGLWSFKADLADEGELNGWAAGFKTALKVAVPGSWNEQLQEAGLMDFTGPGWYQRDVFIPEYFRGKTLKLRFGSADYQAKVWVNGQKVVENDLLCLPFEAVISDVVQPGEIARIVVKVTTEFTPDMMTQQVTKQDVYDEGRKANEYFPSVRFDFFPYGGLQRPVYLLAEGPKALQQVFVNTSLEADRAYVRVMLDAPAGLTASVALADAGEIVGQAEDILVEAGDTYAELSVTDPALWEPGNPHLYTLSVTLSESDVIVDHYDLPVGLREVRVEGTRLLLNGKPIFLKGFGRHEDSAFAGRGLNMPLLVKDFHLLKWVNANSFRTSHYPYAEEQIEMADREGILVISELMSINLDFRKVTEKTLDHHKRCISAQFARDHNNPSVIAWSLSNEPGYLGELEYHNPATDKYWKALTDHARSIDNSRPLTIANVQSVGAEDSAFNHVDIVSVNRYYGWYDNPGQIEQGARVFKEQLDAISANYRKPILVAEFGADTRAGAHSTSPQMFTEEYQEDFLAAYLDVIEQHPACIGAHVWNFADFRTAQHFRRVIFNLKGVFTRERTPKKAAFMLRSRWAKVE